MVANRYNAGTAYVSIVPVFGGNQKKIAEEMRKQFSKRENYDALENGLRQAVQRGLKDAPAEMRDAMKRTSDRVVKDVERQARETGKVSARTIKESSDREFGNYFVQLAKRGVKDLEKNLGGFKIRPGLSDDWVGVLRDIKRDVDVINRSFTEGGTRSAKRIEEAYERISASMERAAKLRAGAIGGIPKADAMSLRKAQEAFGPYSSAIADKKTLDEVRDRIKEQARLENERIKVESRSNRAREAEARRHLNAQLAIAESERKQRAANLKALRRAEEEEREAGYKASFGTAREQFEDPDKLGSRGTRKQERIEAARRETVERTRRSVQGLMDDLSRVDSRRFVLRFDSRSARAQMEELNKHLSAFRGDDGVGRRISFRLSDDEARRRVQELKVFLSTFDDAEFNIDLRDEEARARLAGLKALIEQIRDIDMDVDVDVKDLAKAHAQLKAISREVDRDLHQRVKVDVKNVDRDIQRIRRAVDALRDKRVGIDITHRDAMANIAIVQSALRSLRDKEVDLDIDVDVDRLGVFNRRARIAESRLRNLSARARDAKVSFSDSTQAFRLFNPLLAGVAFLGAPAISTLGGITAALGGLTSMLPGAVAGLSTLGFAFIGLEDAMKKKGKAEEALATAAKERTEAQKEAIEAWEAERDALGEAAEAFTTFLAATSTRMTAIQRGARDGLFPGLITSLTRILDIYEKPFTEFLERTGRLLGTVSKEWAHLLTTSTSAAWFQRVGTDAQKYTLDFSNVVRNTAGAIAGLTDAFRPFAYDISDWLVDATGRFDKWANSLGSNAKFFAFMDAVKSTGPLLREMVAGISELFITFTIALEPFTIAITTAINNTLDFLNALDPGVLGAFLGAAGGLVAGLMVLAGVMSGVGAAAKVIEAAGKSLFTKLAFSIGSFVAVNSTAIGAIAASGDAATVLGEAAVHVGKSFEGAANFGRDLWALIGDLLGAIEPLIPAIADLAATALDLATGLGGGLLGAVSALITGPLAWLFELFSNLSESGQQFVLISLLIGTALGKNREIISDVAGRLASLVGKVFDFVEASGGLGGAIGALGSSAQEAAAGGINTLTEKLAPLPGMAGRSARGIGGIGAAITGLAPALGVAAAIGAALVAIEVSAKRAQEAQEELARSTEVALTAIGDAGAEVGAVLDKHFTDKNRWTGGFEGLNEALEVLELRGTAAASSTSSAIKRVEERFSALDAEMASLVQSGNLDGALATFSHMSDAFDEAGISQEELIKQFPDFVREMQHIRNELDLQISDEELLASLRKGEVPDAMRTAMEGSEKYENALAGVGEKLTEAEKRTRDYIAATDELSGRFLSQEEANLRYQEVLLRFDEHMKTATKTLNESTKAGQENRRMFMELAKATSDKALADLEATGDADAYTNSMWNQRERLRDLAVQFGMTDDEADEYVNTLLEIPRDVRTKAELKDHASKVAREIVDELGKIKDKTVTVTTVYKDEVEKGRTVYRKGPYGAKFEAQGDILIPMAAGGLTPMPNVAQMVHPNTWRVVGDRMDVEEAYIPLDGSKRSKAILMEALVRMPGMLMHDGGIVQFAAGAVAAPTVTPANAEAGTEGAGDMSAVSAAFEALSAELTASWGSLLDALLARAEEFYVALTEVTAAFTAAEIARWEAFSTERLAADALFKSQLQLATETFLAAEAERHRVFMYDTLLPSTVSAHGLLQQAWGAHYGDLTARAGAYRAEQMGATQHFHDALMHEIHSFGSSARSGWSDIWSDLVASAGRIFSRLPADVGRILSEVSGKMNTHIVDPYNKIVSDLELKKELKIARFPVQSHRDGGVITGYTPGRDVHTFFSPTGGVLNLSGGEPVLRPEAGVVLGKSWVDGVNHAARSGGTAGVRRWLEGQGLATGGFVQSFASGGTLIDAANWWVRRGARGSRHPAFGGAVRSGHSKNSLHYVDKAVDLNYGPGGTSSTEMAFFDKYLPEFKREFPRIRVIWRAPGHFNHMHIDVGRGGDIGKFSSALGGAGDLFDIKGEMGNFVKKARAEIAKALGGGMEGVAGFATGVGEKLFNAIAEEKSDEFFDTRGMMVPGGDFKPGSGVMRWRPEVIEALKILNQPTSEAVVNMVLRRMQRESNGNPRAINLWDINARRGHPSKGLMQVIDPTFRSHGHPGYKSNIWDPLSNILAGMRWSIYRYGSLAAGFNRRGGYAEGTSGIDLRDLGAVKPLLRDRGGPLPQGYSLTLNNLGHEETVLPETTADVARLFTNVETALGDHQAGARDAVAFYDAKFYTDPQETAEAIERTRRMTAPPPPSFV